MPQFASNMLAMAEFGMKMPQPLPQSAPAINSLGAPAGK